MSKKAGATLAKLKAEGKVRDIGVSNFDAKQMERAARIAPITSLQPPYSMLRRSVESEILPYAVQNNIGVIAYSPMGSGLLERRDDCASESSTCRKTIGGEKPRLSGATAITQFAARRVAEVDRREVWETPAVVAIAWVLHNQAVTAAIVGMRGRVSLRA